MTVYDDKRPGAATIRLLAEEWTVRILRELTAGPARPIELEPRLPEVAHSVLIRRLGALARLGALEHERVADLHPRAYYSLGEAGRALLEIPAACAEWEQRWSPPPRSTPGVWVLRLLGDTHAWAVVLALAEQPGAPSDVELLLPEFGRSATRQRIGQLLRNGLLARVGCGPRVYYMLTSAARKLLPIAAHAARWETEWAPAHARLSVPSRRPPRQMVDGHRTRRLVRVAPLR